jgi:phage host-nuclease inhibitor protein Gam
VEAPEVPQTLEAADRDMQEMRRLRTRIDEENAERATRSAPIVSAIKSLQEQLDGIDSEVDAVVEPLQVAFFELEKRVIAFVKYNKRKLTTQFRSKTIPFPSGGTASIRLSPKRLKVGAKLNTVLKALKSAGHPEFIETKESIKKDALKRRPDVVAKINGLSIVQDEKITIELDD